MPRTDIITLLSVSPHEEDHIFLQSLFGHSRWTVLRAPNLLSADALLQTSDPSVVVCECDLMPGTWSDLLSHVQALPQPPSFIVTSRLADDLLWAKALNLGAYDVLAKPFERAELLRSVRMAWEHWRRAVNAPAATPSVMRAAS
jgi:DNA-binding response OmpR family regulator